MARTPKHIQNKWQVCYWDDLGHYGIIGYILFDTKDAAMIWGADYMKKNSLIKKIVVQHPAPFFSNY